MQYVSAILVMGLYGMFIEDSRMAHILRYGMINRNRDSEYAPFMITTSMDIDGQIVKTIVQSQAEKNVGHNQTQKFLAVSDYLRSQMTMPPILEVEYLKEALNLDEETAAILEQLGYLSIMWYVDDRTRHSADLQQRLLNNNEVTSVAKYLESDGAIIEVEELSDFPQIIANKKMIQIKYPKVRSWDVSVLYAPNFRELYRMCEEHTQNTKQIVYNMPVLLGMFMSEYVSDGLEEWSKSARLSAEQRIQDFLRKLTGFTHSVTIGMNDKFTYGLCVSVTAKDNEFISNMLNYVVRKLHELNKDIGLISYNEYKSYRRETINADVRLTSMDIDWSDEMKRAEREAKEKAQA